MSIRKIVKKALNRTLSLYKLTGFISDKIFFSQSSLISRLIFDTFGGEILKTRYKNKWHFYNRIDGERIDFTRPKLVKSFKDKRFEEIPSTPDETDYYFAEEDYYSFFIIFLRTFEEIVGLRSSRHSLTF